MTNLSLHFPILFSTMSFHLAGKWNLAWSGHTLSRLDSATFASKPHDPCLPWPFSLPAEAPVWSPSIRRSPNNLIRTPCFTHDLRSWPSALSLAPSCQSKVTRLQLESEGPSQRLTVALTSAKTFYVGPHVRKGYKHQRDYYQEYSQSEPPPPRPRSAVEDSRWFGGDLFLNRSF